MVIYRYSDIERNSDYKTCIINYLNIHYKF